MFKQMLVVAAGSLFALSAFAIDSPQIAQSIVLKDGSTVHVFRDGKMGMENQLGQVVSMKEGHVMQAKDGQSIAMVGDETGRLAALLRTQYAGGK